MDDSDRVEDKDQRRQSGNDCTSTTVTYHKISYSIPVKERGKKFNKLILDDCTGIMRPGLNAIMGTTGSGKTTLLDILAARKDKSYLSGSVLVNGQPQTNNFRLMAGFVVQDDTIWGTLTVRENLHFSASLRLPKRFTQEDRTTRVNTIINDLGLTKVADSKVGTVDSRGVSGGERKRTCIGMELIINPEVLFLDEPTTGLDSTTALTVIKLLQNQAQQQRTIVLSIHQPRYSIFKLFDHVTFVSQGKVVYAGRREDSLDYFEKLGYKCERYNNPADHFLDVMRDEENHNLGTSTNVAYKNENNDKNEADEENFSEDGGSNISLATRYRNSKIFNEVFMEASTLVNNLQRHKVAIKRKSATYEQAPQILKYQSSFLRQFRLLCKRTSLNTFRQARGFFTELVIKIVIGLAFSAVFYKFDRGPSGLQNRLGLLFVVILNMVFTNLSAIAVFIQQRPIYRHESANGYYRCSAYFISKVICDVIPMRIVPVVVYSSILYFTVGLQYEIEKFLIFLLTLILVTMSAAALAIFISSSVNTYALANILTTLAMLIALLFSGFLVLFGNIPVWLRWMRYLSIYNYAFGSLLVNELRGLTFTGCGTTGNASCMSGNQYLKTQGLNIDSHEIWTNCGALLAITVGLFLLSYIQMRRMRIFT